MEETLYALALSCLQGISQSMALELYRKAGSATAAFLHHNELEGLTEKARTRLAAAMERSHEALKRAEEELKFAGKNGIRILCLGDADYPMRLRECDDAPLVLFFRGGADLNAHRILAVVGTRHITEQGKDICRNLCAEISKSHHNTLIISGLAYGVDIHAHRSALDNRLPTVAVLAHGLDRIYPPLHRATAADMLAQGGLLTEYMSGTRPDKGNFVRRNRIIAGAADATVVVESAAKGGALITARLAQDYNREVFAFPGRVTDQYSEGCNRLIRDNVATLCGSASDILTSLGWEERGSTEKPVQRELFPQLPEEEQRVAHLLAAEESLPINRLVVMANMPVGQIRSILFELEMKGVVKPMAGGQYRLLR